MLTLRLTVDTNKRRVANDAVELALHTRFHAGMLESDTGTFLLA